MSPREHDFSPTASVCLNCGCLRSQRARECVPVPLERRRKTYDPRCWDLAQSFLEDGLIGIGHQERIHQLASAIQQTLEEWIESNPPNCQ